MRIVIGIEYDGQGFHGWEVQRNGATVQAALEAALSRVADTPIHTVCAGRTDAGVHAFGQVAHFDTESLRDNRAWVLGANSNLPGAISVLWAQRVAADFHARFSAERREYCYVILNRKVRPAVLNGRVSWEYQQLDERAMGRAARDLIGEHDFSAYRAAGCQARHARRKIFTLTVTRQGPFVMVAVSANAFLQHMVRNIVGVLVAIGSGRRPPEWAGEVLASRDRRCGGVTARACGLYLTGVRYPDRFALPRPGQGQYFWQLADTEI